MAKILDRVHGPADLRPLTPEELSTLAMEVRTLILESVAKNGGHLASNLGAVELTLALHLAFDSPRDKIVWDVGHQCYTHKIVTGRKDRFGGLRRRGGVLGFPCREESEHDVFNTGHASTALSAALGLAVARDRAGQRHHVVAVVGDGSLTGGVALEAMNQIGHLRERLIIVLNYNEMSISLNVGAWSKYFSYLVSGHRYIRMKDQAKSILRRVPGLGAPIIKAGRAMEELVKKTLFPGFVFKELGIRYIGPVHGHNIQSLVDAFETAKSIDGPVLIQCVTQKGKGFQPARLHPEKFHGAGPFKVATGEPLQKEWGPSFSSAFGGAMIKIAKKDDKVLAISAAMGEGTGLREFSEKLPDRFFDVGIAEQHAVTFAAGLALAGLKPVVAIYSTFL
jgi:1-deoxy-D-xylulose-5-phosphate synthase